MAPNVSGRSTLAFLFAFSPSPSAFMHAILFGVNLECPNRATKKSTLIHFLFQTHAEKYFVNTRLRSLLVCKLFKSIADSHKNFFRVVGKGPLLVTQLLYYNTILTRCTKGITTAYRPSAPKDTIHHE